MMALQITAFTITERGEVHVKCNRCPLGTTCLTRNGRRCPYLRDATMDGYHPYVRCRCPSKDRQVIDPKLMFYDFIDVPPHPTKEPSNCPKGHDLVVRSYQHQSQGRFDIYLCHTCRLAVVVGRGDEVPFLFEAIIDPGGMQYDDEDL